MSPTEVRPQTSAVLQQPDFGYKIIIQYPKALVSKDYVSKMPTYYAVNGGVSDP